MLAGALLGHNLGTLVDGLLLLPQLHIRPEVQVAHHDMDEGFLGLGAPHQLLQVVRARDGAGMGGSLRERHDLDLGRGAVGVLSWGSYLEVVLVPLAPEFHQGAAQKDGDPLLSDLSPVLLDELEARLQGIGGEAVACGCWDWRDHDLHQRLWLLLWLRTSFLGIRWNIIRIGHLCLCVRWDIVKDRHLCLGFWILWHLCRINRHLCLRKFLLKICRHLCLFSV